MPIKRLLFVVAASLIGYLVISRYRQGSPSAPAPAASPIAPIVEEVLHQHEGEESPIVQAFAAAVEEEHRLQ